MRSTIHKLGTYAGSVSSSALGDMMMENVLEAALAGPVLAVLRAVVAAERAEAVLLFCADRASMQSSSS